MSELETIVELAKESSFYDYEGHGGDWVVTTTKFGALTHGNINLTSPCDEFERAVQSNGWAIFRIESAGGDRQRVWFGDVGEWQ